MTLKNFITLKNIDFNHRILFLSFCLLIVSGVASTGPAYDFSKLKREKPGRGLVVVRENESTVNLSWRYLSSDPISLAFDVFRSNKKLILKTIPFIQTILFGFMIV